MGWGGGEINYNVVKKNVIKKQQQNTIPPPGFACLKPLVTDLKLSPQPDQVSEIPSTQLEPQLPSESNQLLHSSPPPPPPFFKFF